MFLITNLQHIALARFSKVFIPAICAFREIFAPYNCISVFDELARYGGLGHPPTPPSCRKKIITITPVMQAPRPPLSPQSAQLFLRWRGGGGGGGDRIQAAIRDCADSFKVKRKSRLGSTRSIQLKLSPVTPRVRPLGSFLPPLPPGACRISVRAAIFVVRSRTPTSYHLWSLIMLTIRRLRHQ